MRTDEAERLRLRARQEYERERQALENRYKARLDAVDWLCGLNGSENQKRPETNVSAVQDVLPGLPSRFTRKDVAAALARKEGAPKMTRATLAKTLARLVERGDIAIKQQGRGRRATVYHRSSKN